jgi:hypothetical protein
MNLDTVIFPGFSLPDLGAYTLPIILIFIVFFLLVREFFCWYWKINESLEILRKIEINTRKIEKIEDLEKTK